MITTPIAEVMLRVRLAEALTPSELETVSRIAESEESVDAAVIKILRAGMEAIRPAAAQTEEAAA